MPEYKIIETCEIDIVADDAEGALAVWLEDGVQSDAVASVSCTKRDMLDEHGNPVYLKGL